MRLCLPLLCLPLAGSLAIGQTQTISQTHLKVIPVRFVPLTGPHAGGGPN
jgi:hypothetical protein